IQFDSLSSSRLYLLAFAEGPRHCPLSIPSGNALPLIISLFTPGNCQFDFNQSPFQINPDRDKSISLLLYISGKFVNLPSIQQKLTRPYRIPVEYIALLIRTYMHVVEINLTIPNISITIPYVYPAK